MKRIKSLTIMLMVTMFFSILPTNVLAKGISKNVKSSTSTTRTFAPIIPKTSEPPVPGSGDIVAFDTRTTYVTQSTPVSLIFNIVFSVLVAEGFAKIGLAPLFWTKSYQSYEYLNILKLFIKTPIQL